MCHLQAVFQSQITFRYKHRRPLKLIIQYGACHGPEELTIQERLLSSTAASTNLNEGTLQVLADPEPAAGDIASS